MAPETRAAGAERGDLTILKVRNLVVKFGSATILSNINLDILEGEVVGIVGMSGSGKTTLLSTIMGVIPPSGGDVYYKPQRILRTREDTTQFKAIRSDPDDIKHTFGFSAQTPSFYTKLTVKENLDFFGTMYGLPAEVKRTNAEILLDLVGLTRSADKLAERLSGGMQKRLDIACALIHNPHVLILDEPTADLDPVLRSQMWELVRRINHRGTTVILASHFLEELETLCTRIAILYERQIVAMGTPLELQQKFHTGEMVVMQTADRDYSKVIDDLKRAFKLTDKHFLERNGKLEVHVPDTTSIIEELGEDEDVDATPREGDIVPTLNAQDVLKRIMRLFERDREALLYISAARTDLGSVFEGIILEGRAAKGGGRE